MDAFIEKKDMSLSYTRTWVFFSLQIQAPFSCTTVAPVRWFPLYLVVHGVFLIIVIILRLVQSRREKDRKKDSNNKKSRKENCIELITTIIHIFLNLWFFYDKYMYIQFD